MNMFASGSKADSFICITLGTGIGSGIIINGKIYNGLTVQAVKSVILR